MCMYIYIRAAVAWAIETWQLEGHWLKSRYGPRFGIDMTAEEVFALFPEHCQGALEQSTKHSVLFICACFRGLIKYVFSL